MYTSQHRLIRISIATSVAAVLCTCAIGAAAQQSASTSTGMAAISSAAPDAAKVDFAKAKPLPLPKYPEFSAERFNAEYAAALDKPGTLENPNYSRDNPGDGVLASDNPHVAMTSVTVKKKENTGTANLPFSTARADLDPQSTNTLWPYRASGKLFFVDSGDTYVCSGAMIGRGIVVTAAHCVSQFGEKRFFSDFKFIPGYREGAAPFGVWTAAKVYAPPGYLDGTAPCINGVVCEGDVAVIVLDPQKGPDNKNYYVGKRTGWYSYWLGKEPFTSSGLTHVTQIGYPSCLDNGERMQRNDAQGAVSASNHKNTVIGSLMCGGSSGGPWIANFGIQPALTDTTPGAFARPNVVIGVTSWGTINQDVKRQGASPFVSSNIGVLAKAACKDYPDACND
jgi:V8-like Glu-specific endopeptidase